jgi:uncharacterized YigZ family protein
MYCVKSSAQFEELIKKSRFIGVIVPCAAENAALQQLKQLYDAHPHANHIAFAYRIKTPAGLVCRFHDAGEPTGTAGKPIFQHLEGKQLINVLVAVIRYFGGVKLGAGGLTRAYGNTARQVIEVAEMIEYVEFATLELSLDYKHISQLEYQLKKLDGQIIQQDFSGQVKVLIRLPENNVKNLQAILSSLFMTKS